VEFLAASERLDRFSGLLKQIFNLTRYIKKRVGQEAAPLYLLMLDTHRGADPETPAFRTSQQKREQRYLSVEDVAAVPALVMPWLPGFN